MEDKKLKIVVYAICKNEEKFVDRWVESMNEADEIIVLDTGSTDKTVEKLKQRNVKVSQKVIKPWRFDNARNESLKLVPKDTDVCVCTDLDEVFSKGWRKTIERVWKQDTKILKYIYVWNTLQNGENGITFYYEKIHSYKNFKWIYPVHEILFSKETIKPQNIKITNEITLRHFPDETKSRSQYLNLLELSVKENPKNDRNLHYLGREYLFNKQYDNSIKTLKKHLKISSWNEEKSASLRYVGDCYFNKKEYKQAKKYYEKSIIECPEIRESFLSLAQFYYSKNDYLNCIFVTEKMLTINTRQLTYMTNPLCWNEYPYDLLSFCYYKIKQFNKAKINCEIAHSINKNDKRIENNLKIYQTQSK